MLGLRGVFRRIDEGVSRVFYNRGSIPKGGVFVAIEGTLLVYLICKYERKVVSFNSYFIHAFTLHDSLTMMMMLEEVE